MNHNSADNYSTTTQTSVENAGTTTTFTTTTTTNNSTLFHNNHGTNHHSQEQSQQLEIAAPQEQQTEGQSSTLEALGSTTPYSGTTEIPNSIIENGTQQAASTTSKTNHSVLMSVLQDPQEETLLVSRRDSFKSAGNPGTEETEKSTTTPAPMETQTVTPATVFGAAAQIVMEQQQEAEVFEKALPAAGSLKRPYEETVTGESRALLNNAQQQDYNPQISGHEDDPSLKRQKLMDSATTSMETTTTNIVEMHPPLATAAVFETPRESNNNSPNGETAAAAAAAKKVNNEQWELMYEQLKKYKQQEGHCLVPKRQGKLGTWVETQRVQYKRLPRIYDPNTGLETGVLPNKRLSAERLQKLEAIGFAWSAKAVRKNSLTGAKTNVGVSNAAAGAPNNFGSIKIAPNANIAGAMSTNAGINPVQQAPQQQQQQQARRNRLNDAQWEDMYQRLVNFRNEHGHTLVPRKYDKDPKLSTWVETQRVLWNRDYRKIDPKEAVAAAAATAAATTVALADFPEFATGNAESTADPVYESAPVMAAGGAVLTEQATDASLPNLNINPRGAGAASIPGDAAVPSIPGAAKIAADKGKRLTPERKQKLDEIGFVWSLRSKRIEDHWDEMFKQLLAYKEEHGDTLVPSRYAANLKLGKWVETQRYEYTKLQRANAMNGSAGADQKPASQEQPPQASSTSSRPTNPRLTEERLRRLEEIGFQWKVKHKMQRYYQKQWDGMFERLKAFKDINGHVMVAKRYPPDPRLGTWVHTQRIQYRKLMAGTKKAVLTPEEESVMKSCSDEVTYRLTEERRARLESIGFVWNMREGDKGVDAGRIARNSYDDQWDMMFQKLQEYRATHGNCLVPKRYKEFPKLGTWVDTQRVQYKKLQKKLAEQGKPYDESVGLEGEIVAPVEQGTVGVGVDAATDGASTAKDTKDGAKAAASKPLVGRLTDERIRRLEEIGFVWSLRDDWQKHYEELKAYKKVHGHCNVPARYAANRRLGIWVSAQRQQYKTQLKNPNQPNAVAGRRTAPLTQERIALLNEIGFTWTIRSRDSLGESWNQRLEELKRFKEKHGHCMVPSRYAESPELGIWVGTQRTQYRLYMKAKETGTQVPGATAMNETRIKLLEELGFVWALRGNREDHMNLRQFHMRQEGGEANALAGSAVAASTAPAAPEAVAPAVNETATV